MEKNNLVSLAFALSFLLLHFLRMWGAIYQMTRGTIRDGCLRYDADAQTLIKSPFGPGCFRGLGMKFQAIINHINKSYYLKYNFCLRLRNSDIIWYSKYTNNPWCILCWLYSTYILEEKS